MDSLIKEWDGENTKKYWYTHTIRTVILALWNAGISNTWAIEHLKKLESNMLIGHDTSGRMDELNEQINAWFELGEIKQVRKLLITSLNSTFSVGYRKDCQLDYWIKWYHNIAKSVPDKAEALEDSSHIQRLLRAKHKAAEHGQDDKNKNDEEILGR